MRARAHREAPEALDLIESAVGLLREAPVAVWGWYYLGSLPFVLAFLFFWAEMSGSPEAHLRCAPAALGVAVAFGWMKAFQMLFTHRLWGVLTGPAEAPLGWKGGLQAVARQLAWHTLGLWLIPVAAVAMLPLAWVIAFFQSVTVLGGRPGSASLGRRASTQAQLWPMQNHILLWVLALFGGVVLVDVAVGLVWAPRLLKTLLGIETEFSRGPWPFLNTTFLALCLGAGYLCLDPLLKAVYVLRCFHGEGRRSGDDLRQELGRCRRERSRAARVVGGALVAVCFGVTAVFGADPVVSEVPPDRAQGAVIAADALDEAIQRVLQGAEFQWRLPRSEIVVPPEELGFLDAFLQGVARTVKSWTRAGGRAFEATLEWVGKWLSGRFRSGPGAPTPVGVGWMAWPQMLVFLLLVGVAYGVVYALLRLRLRRRAASVAALTPVTTTPPDLEDEAVTAAQLPEEEWVRLAREQAEHGEWRLALRALYLAGLAHVAARGWVSIERFKSNRDYERELGRRARGLTELEAAFVRNGGRFERVWYGRHLADAGLFAEGHADWERIQSC